MSIHPPSIYQALSHPMTYQSINQSFKPSIYLPIYPFIHSSIHPPTYLSIYPSIYIYTHTHLHTYIYRVSQEECARLREGVPYVKVYRYKPKHLYPKLNGYGYGDNGQRKVGASCGSKYCNLHSWYVTWQCERLWQWNVVFTVPAWRFAQSAMLRHRRAFSCIVLVTLRTTMTRVRVFL